MNPVHCIDVEVWELGNSRELRKRETLLGMIELLHDVSHDVDDICIELDSLQ